MKKEDIVYMENCLTVKLSASTMSKDPIWLRAFAFYNENNSEKLGVNCSICYVKVFVFCRKKINEGTI